MRAARWLVTIVSLLLVVTFSWWDLSRSHAGPGPVHPAHAAVPELQNGANCAGCHRDGAVAASLCLDCHDAIAQQAELQSGVHANLTQSQCATCHPEHHGATVPLLPPHAFKRAGILNVSDYDHRHVAFELTGVHSELTCVRCHEHATAATPPVGGRFLGASQQCVSCHDDPHTGAFGQQCASCHGQERSFAEAPGFSHLRFALDGAHGKVECATCHQPGSGREVADEELAQLDVRSCRDCHENPHDGELAAAPEALHFAKADDCARCHEVDQWASARPTVAEHGALGFALRGVHAEADCATCHGGGERQPMWRGEAPRLRDCSACHEDPHTESLLAAVTQDGNAGNGCADCHLDADPDFASGRMSPAHHAATGFALAVPHADLACNACHTGATQAARFPGRVASDCRSCHTDAHAGQFMTAGVVQQCTECHHNERFLPHRFGASMHAKSFALTGSHDAVACAACHKEVVAGVRQFAGTKRNCDACHADVHGGRFDKPGRPQSVAGRVGCARCHDTSSFGHVLTKFDHALWTDYELVGAHKEVACGHCHDGPAAGRVAAVAGKTCADCHADPHVGQFRIGGTTDCRQCHQATTWQKVNFDHQKDSRFPLDGVHRQVACSKCHPTYEVGAAKVVRYKPLGTKCGDCHKLGRPGGR